MAAELEVRVLNVGSAAGHVRVAVCTEGRWLGTDHVRNAAVPARPGVVAVVIADLPPGVYGVMVHHDANDDGRINRDLLGRPTEGIGFSRDAPMLFGPPRFADAAFRLADQRVVLDITLRFEPRARR